jgi:hypothetical protein
LEFSNNGPLTGTKLELITSRVFSLECSDWAPPVCPLTLWAAPTWKRHGHDQIGCRIAWQVRPDRPPHHRRPPRTEQQPRQWLGVRARLRRRSLPRRLCQGHVQRERRCAIAFLRAAVAHYAGLGIKIERVMTDKGSCYKSLAFRRACKRLKLRHIRTKPYTPKTNGKAERFIQTSLQEDLRRGLRKLSSTKRSATDQLPIWLHRYNWHRPHAGIVDKTSISRLGPTGNNVLRLHI